MYATYSKVYVYSILPKFRAGWAWKRKDESPLCSYQYNLSMGCPIILYTLVT